MRVDSKDKLSERFVECVPLQWSRTVHFDHFAVKVWLKECKDGNRSNKI